MTEPGDALVHARYDDAGNVVETWVSHADPVIRVSVELWAQMDPERSGVLQLDTAGEYVYRFARMESPDMAVFERVEGE
jgi:hypothetical protein